MGTSRNFLYYQPKNNKSETNCERSKADISVMAWVQAMLPIIDKMPDSDWYMITAPDKKSVWNW